jgi:hypothetical protein
MYNSFIYDKLDSTTRRAFSACERVIRETFSPSKDLLTNTIALAKASKVFINQTIDETESKGIFLDMQGWRDLCSRTCDKANWQLITECLYEEFDESCIKEWEEQQNYV